MRVELINTGSELLLGQVVNTHLHYLAEALWPVGLTIELQVTVPDGPPIRKALSETFGRADIVIVTGGLGPTTDDVTRDVAAELLGLDMETDNSIAHLIEERLKTRNIPLTPRVLRQAERPSHSEILHNTHGTAPGLYFPPLPLPGGQRSPHLFLLPGPPRELKPMVETEVVPRLRALVPDGPARSMQTWRVVGVPESLVEEAVGEKLIALGIEPGYCARPGEVDVRIIGSGKQLESAAALLKEAFGNAMLPEDSRSLETWLVQELTRRNETLSTAESCTGGALASQITNAPGSSAIFGFGFVTYANTAKQHLGVPAQLLREHGAVSAAVAEALAQNALRIAGADYALSTTGIAGPSGGSDDKPVGTVFIALACKGGGVIVEKHRFNTERQTFKHLVVQTALNLLRKTLLCAPTTLACNL
ncbi:MAG: nicotinamide-nucleotide amidase [Verrucomicrobia bacterium]|nr:MAG: nicotinamide-nucleotide amidase [Verrucomicrobiota bacterium]